MLVRVGGIAAVLAAACGGGGAVPDVPPVPAEQVDARPGIDVLLRDSMHLVRGRRVGLVTNHTGIDTAGVSDVELLRAAGVELVALFSPEHGFRGAAAPGEAVQTTRDSATDLPIYSLYGRTTSPTDAMLRGVDLLIVDLQDVGARYYTYISTAIEVMRAGARRNIPVMILDRPNP
ncbi:MAG TPA: exo-beta-N-acetylmuramidase NamZ domain-containing protein, partial [Gemmatimonadales bacterium]